MTKPIPEGWHSVTPRLVVDDAAMRITEVVRGEDLLLSTARQLLLYRALRLAVPTFYHCPLLTDEAGVRLAKRHEALSLRTLHEALSNATRHGEAVNVQVELRSDADALRLIVADHGPGFDIEAAEQSGRLGLAGMRERAELLGGTFEVRSKPGDGTVVMACWPLVARADL